MPLSNLFLDGGPPPQETPGQAAPYTLLFVDDEPQVLSALRRIFRQESYRILTASSSAEALDILEHEPVALMVSDHRMPGMTGAELLRTVRSRWPEVIRIMLTGYADVQSIMGAVNEGAVYKFITKPWIDEDLRITVARALEQYSLQKEVCALREANQEQEEKLESFSALFRQDRGLLAKVLLREKKLSQQEFEDAIRKQHESSELMYRILVQAGLIEERAIASALSKAFKMEILDLKEVRVSPDAAGLFPPQLCRDNLLLPLKLEGDVLTLAMADGTDMHKRENIEALTGLRLNIVLALGSDLEAKCDSVYGTPSSSGEKMEGEAGEPMAIDEIDMVVEEAEEADVDELLRSSTVAPVVRIVNAVFAEALRHGASDIHVQPKIKHTEIRYRIDGLLQDRMHLPPELHNAVVSRIKVLSKMDISDRRRPQDGRITVRGAEKVVDIRVSSLPTLHGEKVVLRILDRGSAVRRVEELGLNQRNIERVRRVARRPQGIIICAGPTGSGKTTLLYSLMREHVSPSQSYGTIEDPVEYYLEQASQVLIREKSGMTFPVALRSMLRQDPDTILVGEMRDQETARIAFQASMTGHLVLSTLHTNNAVASITRLLDLGVERYLIGSSLACVIAQRLVRTICQGCRCEVEPDPAVLRMLDSRAKDIGRTMRGRGCDRCHNTGYAGRLGIFEVLVMTDEIQELLLAGSREAEILAAARDEGMASLYEDAIEKVREGQTTLDEVLRVLGPSADLSRRCVKCDASLERSFNTCPHCGHAVRRRCAQCSTPLMEAWKHCPSCGEGALASPTSSPARSHEKQREERRAP